MTTHPHITRIFDAVLASSQTARITLNIGGGNERIEVAKFRNVPPRKNRALFSWAKANVSKSDVYSQIPASATTA